MDENEELILCEIMNQTLVDNSAMISDGDLALMFGLSVEKVRTLIERLIADEYLIRLAVNRYTVKFDKLNGDRT